MGPSGVERGENVRQPQSIALENSTTTAEVRPDAKSPRKKHPSVAPLLHCGRDSRAGLGFFIPGSLGRPSLGSGTVSGEVLNQHLFKRTGEQGAFSRTPASPRLVL